MQKHLASITNATTALGLTSADKAKVTRLIGSASRMVYSVILRPYLFRHTYSDVYDGTGRERMVLRNWPVLSVDSLLVSGVPVPIAEGFGESGYRLDHWDGFPPGTPQSLTLSGYSFCRGLTNVSVTYTAGYAVSNEAHTVSSAANYTVSAGSPFGTWAVDDGVAYADGSGLLTPVTASPAQGQYIVADGSYTFNSTDAGKPVLLSYSFIPADIEEAVIDIARALLDTDLTGNIKTLKAGDATIERFGPSQISKDALSLLQPYKSVLGI